MTHNNPVTFTVEKRGPGLARAGFISTPHGVIKTPAFVTVGTKATVKAVTTEQLREYVHSQVVLANTYHLYLQPGDEVVRDAGGLHKFMHWDGPTITDSGGFQVFSLGVAFGTNITKFSKGEEGTVEKAEGGDHAKLATIDEDGVTFRSHIDGSEHRFTPERSIEIQNNIGADIIFAFDECTSPTAGVDYQKKALDRTYRWAERCVDFQKKAATPQGLYGVIQGGRFEELRREAAISLSKLDFSGFGIGGSFTKADLDVSLYVVNSILPEEKPRHLLGIGKPEDFFTGIYNGIDTFDCVEPTRIARNGTIYTTYGPVNLLNAKYVRDFSPVDAETGGYVSEHYSKAYLAHLFRSHEILGATLASIHNLHFITKLVADIRQSLLDDNFATFQEIFLKKYHG